MILNQVLTFSPQRQTGNLPLGLPAGKNTGVTGGMWRKFKNYLFGLKTYADLSPDLGVRRRINQSLGRRPALTAEQWFESFWKPLGISQNLATFLYQSLASYSGLDVARIHPQDHLVEDLHLPLVCWFDWQMGLSDELAHQFGIELDDSIDLVCLKTVEELVVYLNRQLVLANHP